MKFALELIVVVIEKLQFVSNFFQQYAFFFQILMISFEIDLIRNSYNYWNFREWKFWWFIFWIILFMFFVLIFDVNFNILFNDIISLSFCEWIVKLIVFIVFRFDIRVFDFYEILNLNIRHVVFVNFDEQQNWRRDEKFERLINTF